MPASLLTVPDLLKESDCPGKTGLTTGLQAEHIWPRINKNLEPTYQAADALNPTPLGQESDNIILRAARV